MEDLGDFTAPKEPMRVVIDLAESENLMDQALSSTLAEIARDAYDSIEVENDWTLEDPEPERIRKFSEWYSAVIKKALEEYKELAPEDFSTWLAWLPVAAARYRRSGASEGQEEAEPAMAAD